MIINISNANIINTREVYFHDNILEDVSFNCKDKRMTLFIINECGTEKRKILFEDAVAFEMTSCDFWGPSPYILDFEYIEKENEVIIPKLMKRQEKDYDAASVKIDNGYIETKITFISGDQLSIVCKKIII